MTVLRRLKLSMKKNGLKNTAFKIYAFLYDLLFDIRYGVDTFSSARLHQFSIESSNRCRGNPYHPTRVLALKGLFRYVEGILPDGRVLMDYGCGKGRVLLLAAIHGFKKARGVDFAPELAGIARRNINHFRRNFKRATEFEVVVSDAVHYSVRPDENVFFFFNPFDDHVLETTIRNINASLMEFPREAVIIYCHPSHRDVLDACEHFRLETHVFAGHQFLLYRNSALEDKDPEGLNQVSSVG